MPVKKTPEKKEPDVEKRIDDMESKFQSQLAQKKGLLWMRRVTHPEESLGTSRSQVNRFVALGKGDRKDQIKQRGERIDMEQALFTETGRCSTGANPEYGRRAGARPVITTMKRQVSGYQPPGVVTLTGQPTESQAEYIARLEQENAELRRLLTEANQKLDQALRELTQMRVDMGKLVDYIDKMGGKK